ncbi:MAG: hypothetical protein ACE37F_15280 [Nannocystaceae bacterium]|nr:hypothetical protein [bacterium]
MARRRFVVATVGLTLAGCRQDPEVVNPTPAGVPSHASRDAVAPPAPAGKTHPDQPEGKTSGGALSLPFLRASRRECTSPCAVMFSIDPIVDTSSDNPFALSGVYWDYGDEGADAREGPYRHGASAFRSKRGPSRETDTNTPLGMHVYQCDAGTCTFHPGVSVRNAAGDWATAWSTVTVRSADAAYPGARTVCVSSTGTWDGDVPCPEGASRARSLPKFGEWKTGTRYLLRRGEQFRSEPSCMRYGRQGIQIGAFGHSADPKPELTRFAIGRESTCRHALTNNRRAAEYGPKFWNENITLTDLRVEAIELGMTFRDITLHDLDMDFERGMRGGSVVTVSTDRCTQDDSLSCSLIPLPQGLYIAGSRLIGSRQEPPKYNLGMLKSTCASFVGVLDSELKVAIGHNMRVECSTRVLALHSDVSGHHLGEGGSRVAPRHAITVRSDGSLDRDMLGQPRRPSSDPSKVFDSRYTVVKDVYLGDPQSKNHSARVTITPSKPAEPVVTRMAVLSGNLVDLEGGAGDGPATFDAHLAGTGLVCYDDNRWQAPKGCGDKGRAAIPEGGYSPARTDVPAPAVPKPPGAY